MFLGLGATFLACFNFTGNVVSTGTINYLDYNVFSESDDLSGCVDYHIEFYNEYDDFGTFNITYYLKYETTLYKYYGINFGYTFDNSHSQIALLQGGAGQNIGSDYSFDTYTKFVGYDDDDSVMYTYKSVHRNFNNYSSSFEFIQDYEIYHHFTIDLTFVPYTETMYQSLTSNETLDYQDGYDKGYDYGYQDGFNNAGNHNFDNGYNDGYGVGYNEGYSDGILDGQNMDAQMTTIFANIFQVAMIPINFFLAIFNFEIFGINISSFVSALLTIAVIIILIKTIFGGKSSND